MKVVYTLKGNIYEAADVELALQFAEAASRQSGMPVRILVEGKAQYRILVGVHDLTITDKHFAFRGITGEIATRRSFQGVNGEILVVICPTIELLQKMQQYQGIGLAIVVPEMKTSSDIYYWLDLNSATDIQTGATLSGIGLPVVGIKRAIGFLKDYCMRLGVKLTEIALWTGEIADVANTIKKQKIFAGYDEVVKYCLQRGLTIEEAELLAKAFCQKKPLKMRGCPDYGTYWKAINDPKWEHMP